MLKFQPIRMCIACRGRYEQKSMLRLQQRGDEIIAYQGFGRSFYLCHECMDNKKKIKSLTKRFKQDEEHFVKFLKEQIENG